MRRTLLTVVLILSVAGLVTRIAVAASSVTDPSPATGHAEVVAQGVVAFDSGTLRWQFSKKTADPAGDPVDLSGPGFAIAEKGTLSLASADGSQISRLATGESGFLPPDGTSTALPLGDSAATIRTIRLASDSTSTAFAIPAGRHDLDLVRDVLATKEHSKITNGELPAAIFVQAGAIAVKNANGGTVELTAGKTGTLTGPLTVTATGSGEAIFFVAVIGPDIQLPPAVSTAEPTSVTTGTINVNTYLCPAGVSVEAATPDTCGNNSGLGSGLFSLTGGDLEKSTAALIDHGIWTWGGLAAGNYEIAADEYPAGYSDFAIDFNDSATHNGDTIQVTLADGDLVAINVYFLAGSSAGGTGTASLGLTFYDCPAGTTVDDLTGSSDPGCTEVTDNPFGVTLTGDNLTGQETTDTLQAVSPTPSLAGDWQWTGLPDGSYTLSFDPIADGDTFYAVRPCGDQSCPDVSGLGNGIDFELSDGGGFTLLVYRIPAS